MIKKFAEVSPCCICGGIPSLEVVYDVNLLASVERYVKLVPIEYFRAMPTSKPSFKRKQQLLKRKRGVHLIYGIKISYKDTRILVSHCDFAKTNYQGKIIFQYRINVLDG